MGYLGSISLNGKTVIVETKDSEYLMQYANAYNSLDKTVEAKADNIDLILSYISGTVNSEKLAAVLRQCRKLITEGYTAKAKINGRLLLLGCQKDDDRQLAKIEISERYALLQALDDVNACGEAYADIHAIGGLDRFISLFSELPDRSLKYEAVFKAVRNSIGVEPGLMNGFKLRFGGGY